jgi:hypothetical protein
MCQYRRSPPSRWRARLAKNLNFCRCGADGAVMAPCGSTRHSVIMNGPLAVCVAWATGAELEAPLECAAAITLPPELVRD